MTVISKKKYNKSIELLSLYIFITFIDILKERQIGQQIGTKKSSPKIMLEQKCITHT